MCIRLCRLGDLRYLGHLQLDMYSICTALWSIHPAVCNLVLSVVLLVVQWCRYTRAYVTLQPRNPLIYKHTVNIPLSVQIV